jgi:hypothetical protein
LFSLSLSLSHPPPPLLLFIINKNINMALPSATHDMLPRGASANVFVIGPDSLDKLPFRPSLHYNLPWLQPVRVRALSFVIANRQGRCVFLDLSLRENWSLPPPPRVVAEIHNDEPGIRHELNVTSEYSRVS